MSLLGQIIRHLIVGLITTGVCILLLSLALFIGRSY